MVCSVGKGTVAEYYLNEQSEYYTGGKEPRGHWYMPISPFHLEDGAEVDASTFRNLHSGLNPDGVALGQRNQSFTSARIGGYDLTFSAPKSVSVLWAVGIEEVRLAIEQAQEIASRAALDVLQQNASFGRRGKGGETLEKVSFFGATFQHGEARPTERADGSIATDPQLHTHSVIFNIAQRGDGSWGALDGRHFYKWKMSVGALYRARLAYELKKTLRLDINVTQNGLFEVSGVPDSVRAHFSTRRSMIENELSTKGLTSTEAQALASTITRTSRHTKSKGDASSEDRHDRWKREAVGIGYRSLEACRHEDPNNPLKPGGFSEAFRAAIFDIPSQLTEHDAVFGLEALYRAAAAVALTTGASTDEVEQVVQEMRTNGSVIEIGHDEIGLPIYSTTEMVQIENDLVETAKRWLISRKHSLPKSTVETRLALAELSDEQRDAVRFVTTGADATVLEGSAGAGKTHALRTVSDIYKQSGYRVIGTSTAWRMANQLSDDLSIQSQATDAWLAQEKSGKPFLNEKSVLIVDEAGQLSSRQMLRVLSAAEKAGAKVVLTGDQRQLQAIGAGPGLRLVAEQTGVVRIDTIVRQKEAWARKAVDDLSLGRADRAVAAFEQKGDLHWCADGNGAVRQAVLDWKEFRMRNPNKSALVIAKTNKQVQDLNDEMRAHLRASGRLRGRDHTIKAVNTSGNSKGVSIAIGDQLVFKKRIDELRVINGTTGTVIGIREDQSGLRLSVNMNGQTVAFNTNEIADDQGRVPLAHGYASTVYSAQGMTVDRAFVVADQTFRRDEIYVASSRAREECSLYVDTESVEKAVCSQSQLSAGSSVPIPREGLRKFLISSWSQAAMKSSTRDYDFASIPFSQKRLLHLDQAAAATKQSPSLPRIEANR